MSEVKPRLDISPIGSWKEYPVIREVIERHHRAFERDGREHPERWFVHREHLYLCENNEDRNRKIDAIIEQRLREGWRKVSQENLQYALSGSTLFREIQLTIDQYPILYSLNLFSEESEFIGMGDV